MCLVAAQAWRSPKMDSSSWPVTESGIQCCYAVNVEREAGPAALCYAILLVVRRWLQETQCKPPRYLPNMNRTWHFVLFTMSLLMPNIAEQAS